jgi:aryl-alcohol dehydrogenase-like predicted oxidoreductase
MEEIVRAFNWCIDKGMALYWATSEWPAYLITEAMNVANRLHLIAPITEVYYQFWIYGYNICIFLITLYAK